MFDVMVLACGRCPGSRAGGRGAVLRGDAEAVEAVEAVEGGGWVGWSSWRGCCAVHCEAGRSGCGGCGLGAKETGERSKVG